MRRRIIITACIATGLGGCAGRAPQPVAIVQSQDRFSDCAEIIAEVQANNQKLQELGSEEGAKVAQNVAAGVAGLFIWPLWFGMDFQGAAGKEVTALQSRQQYLATLAEQKRCGAPTTTSPPPQAPPPPVAVAAPPLRSGASTATNSLPSERPMARPPGTGQTVLFPVTINNPYYPHSTVNVN